MIREKETILVRDWNLFRYFSIWDDERGWFLETLVCLVKSGERTVTT